MPLGCAGRVIDTVGKTKLCFAILSDGPPVPFGTQALEIISPSELGY